MTDNKGVLDKKRQITGRDFIYIITIIVTGVTSYLTSYYGTKAEMKAQSIKIEQTTQEVDELNTELKQYNLETMMYILTSIEKKVDNIEKRINSRP